MKIEVLVALVICFCSVIGSVTYYNVVQQQKFAENLKYAMERGIDPMVIRCSYDKMNDVTCVAYAASGKKAESAPGIAKK